MELLFQILCGLLYLTGKFFGCDYQTTSIIVCIYLWPLLCTISTIPIIIGILHASKWKISTIFLLISSIIYTGVYSKLTYDFIERYNINDSASFMNCMIDLQSIANLIGVTYATLNILIYVVLFSIILLFNRLLYKCVIRL